MKTLVIYNVYVRRLTGVLAGLTMLAVFAYGTLLLMAVSHAARLSSAQNEIQTLTQKISAAESTYLAQTESLDMASAAAMGLVKPAEVSIVYASSPSSLTFNH